jgi:hypothetical protein
VEAIAITEATCEKIVLMLDVKPGRVAPAATATKPAIKAYSMKSWPLQSDRSLERKIANICMSSAFDLESGCEFKLSPGRTIFRRRGSRTYVARTTALALTSRNPAIQNLSSTQNGTSGGFPLLHPLFNIEAEGLDMSKRENRQHQRIPYCGSARVSWEDEQGLTRHVHAKCLDVSKEGLRIEVGEPIPVRSRLLLRANLTDVDGAATVRYSAWSRCKYIVGLNLCHALHDDALAAIRV